MGRLEAVGREAALGHHDCGIVVLEAAKTCLGFRTLFLANGTLRAKLLQNLRHSKVCVSFTPTLADQRAVAAVAIETVPDEIMEEAVAKAEQSHMDDKVDMVQETAPLCKRPPHPTAPPRHSDHPMA